MLEVYSDEIYDNILQGIRRNLLPWNVLMINVDTCRIYKDAWRTARRARARARTP